MCRVALKGGGGKLWFQSFQTQAEIAKFATRAYLAFKLSSLVTGEIWQVLFMHRYPIQNSQSFSQLRFTPG